MFLECTGDPVCRTCAIDAPATCTSCNDGSFMGTGVCTGKLQLHNYIRHLYSY